MGLDATVWADDDCNSELASVRIGNVSLIGDLRKEIRLMSGSFPAILDRVLYSGSHCGDEIPADLVAELRQELLRLPNGSNWLEDFRKDFLGLCQIAIDRKRPIHF